VSPVQRLAVWLYARPRLRRFIKTGCLFWLAAVCVVAFAPNAVADMPQPSVGYGDMMWTGLRDTYGVPISMYRVSTVGPLEAASVVAGQYLQGLSLFNPSSWVNALISGTAQGINNVLAAGILGVECAFMIFTAGVGIWFLQFAVSASWLQWLAAVVQPVVTVLQAMVNHYLVMLFALMACILVGGYIWLAKGKGHGLGIIFSGLGIMALYYLFFNDPVGEMLGPHGVMSIGQYLGFQVAEGAINNGQLAPGDGGAQLSALISLLCTALLRDQIQMINFGTVVDNVPGCASLWSAAIMGGQQDGPAHAMGSCDPAAMTYAQELGLSSAGLFFVVLFVEFWIMVALLWIGWHVIYNGFKALWRVLVLVPSIPLAVAPGALRRNGKKQAVYAIHDGLELFVSIAGLALIAIMDGSVLAGGPPGSGDAISSPLGREIFVLLITVAGAVGYHRALMQLRNGDGWMGRIGHLFSELVKLHQIMNAVDFFSVNAFGNSISGRMRRHHMRRAGRPDDEEAKTSDLEYHGGKKKPPGREPPQPKGDGGGGKPSVTNTYVTNNYYGGQGGQTGNNMGGNGNGNGQNPPNNPNGRNGNQQPPYNDDGDTVPLPNRQNGDPQQPNWDPQQNPHDGDTLVFSHRPNGGSGQQSQSDQSHRSQPSMPGGAPGSGQAGQAAGESGGASNLVGKAGQTLADNPELFLA
jgi:hypothetical protein